MTLIKTSDAEKRLLIGAVRNIEKECFSVPWSERSVEAQLSTDSAVFAAVSENDEIIGYVAGQTAADECELYRIAVLPCFRRKGYAAKLMEYFISECRSRDIKSIFLEVRKENTPARTLYERYGFMSVGVRKNYYSYPADDAVVYRLEI